ncbi:MAG: hypothetical protein KJZ54_06600 [Phycisphaerales bacterium]|nr:hypothetical protein [Phycisphaerales bacterium]
MAGLDARIDAWRKLSPGRRLGALAQAVGAASDEDLEALGPELIELALVPERASSARREVAARALVEVARNWRRFGSCLRRTSLAVGRGRWEEALRQVGSDGDPATRYAAVRVAQESGDPSLAPLLGEMLGDADRRIAAAAGAGLLRLCARASGVESRALLGADAPGDVLARPMDPGAPDAADAADDLAGIVARCMAGASIRRTRHLALCALVLLPRPFEADRLGPGRARLASELRSSDDHAGMRAALRRSDSAVARRLALWWLADRAVAPVALERLSRAESVAEHEAVLRSWHLLARPARRGRVRRVQVRTRAVAGVEGSRTRVVSAGGVLPDGAGLGRLSAAARVGVSAFVEALNLDEATRSAVLGPLVTDPEPSVRFAAARAASASDLPDYCLDPDPIVARTAALLWSAVGTPSSGPRPSDAARRRFAGRLCLSPHGCVRLIAEADHDRLDPLDPDSASSRLAARRLLASNPDELVSMLRGLLVQASEAQRLRAIGVVRRFGLHRRLADALLTLAAGGAGATDREVATAVAALGDPGAPPNVAGALNSCLSRPDARVRANAVEALAKRARRARTEFAGHESVARERESLVEFKSDGHHRIRANALRAMLVLGDGHEAAVELGEMLRDERPGHRLAGVWLASRALTIDGRSAGAKRWTELASEVVRLSRSESDERVRRRAVACAARVRGVVAGRVATLAGA